LRYSDLMSMFVHTILTVCEDWERPWVNFSVGIIHAHIRIGYFCNIFVPTNLIFMRFPILTCSPLFSILKYGKEFITRGGGHRISLLDHPSLFSPSSCR
jgi:hypothetical protein